MSLISDIGVLQTKRLKASEAEQLDSSSSSSGAEDETKTSSVGISYQSSGPSKVGTCVV